MKRLIVMAGCLLLITFSPRAQADTSKLRPQDDSIIQRIVLIGDAGQLTDGRHPVVDAVRQLIKLDKKTTVLFLGDNLYKMGLPDNLASAYNTARAVLDSQLSIAEGTPAKVLMIPGNHDWENGSRGGYDAVIREQIYVDFIHQKNAEFYPKDGCPGPVEISLGTEVTVIMFDSQWWIHPFDKPGIESDCNCKTKDELVAQIQDIAARNSKKLIILACHHPFRSNGIHGGFFRLKQHIFPFTDIFKSAYIPLPILGSIYPIARSVFGTPQDLKHPNYQNMIDRISTAIKEVAPNVVFVAGHEHNLEHLKDSSYNYIISGGGCKESRASSGKKSEFISTLFGFAVMEVSKNKNVTVDFYTVADSIKKAYSAKLLNFTKIPEAALDTAKAVVIEDPWLKYKDTITVAASKRYPPISGMKRYFMGQNYRYEWSEPVNMKVFNLSKEKGGLKIVGLGGDKQTKSLRLVDKKGKEWVLRSMNKTPTKAIPESFRGTLAEDLAAELNSATNPYGALAFPILGKAIDVTVAKPELFFVPDDPALNFYRPLFSNNVCFLEPKDATIDGTDTKSTAKVFSKMLDENDHLPDQQVVLRARLLDIVTGDFDRNLDQWRWGVSDTGKGKIYYPIPRDRDQAFFYSDGRMLKFISGRALPFLKGFRKDIPKIRWLGYTARDFDRIYLTDLDASEWKETTTYVQRSLNDSVIRAAVKKMPPEIVAIDGETIANKMISRRDLLSTEIPKYYRFLSKKVNISGSNQREYFKVTPAPGGIQVRVYAVTKGNDTSFIRYSRIFTSKETYEIRLYGLNDDDVFEIDSAAKSRIKLRIIGGKGIDTFNLKGHVESLLYDMKSEGNVILHNKMAKKRFTIDPPANERTIFGFEYNTTKFPQLFFGYNTDDGTIIGAGMSKRTYGFRNLPYAADQRLSVLYAPGRQAYQVRYKGEFNHITRNYDMVVQANYSNPSIRNFTGFGNNTKVPSNDFDMYRTRYNSSEIEALFRLRYFENLHFMIGPYFYHYNNHFADNKGTILEHPQSLGLDSADIFSKKSYLGGKLALLLDNRNNDFFPTRGVRWYNELLATRGMTNSSENFNRFTSDMSIHASMSDPAKVVAVLKVGGGVIIGKHYEYFQLLNFGPNNTLNGFRKNRYSGTSSLYSSFEMKVQLINLDSYILPGPFGLTGFIDAGKVWMKGIRSRTWHAAFGGGFYFMPFNLFIINATAGFSRNEKMINFSIGTKMNLSY
ncbi:MAG: BamA/TamA family outer membrane protein [Chitinophagaceae bacterium]